MSDRPLQIRENLSGHDAFEALDRRLRGLAGVLVTMAQDPDADEDQQNAAALGAEVAEDCRALAFALWRQTHPVAKPVPTVAEDACHED